MDDRVKILNKLMSIDRVVIDVETSGLDWKTNYAVGYVFAFSGNPDDSYYIPVRHGWTAPSYISLYNRSCYEEQTPFEIHLDAILKLRGVHIIGHNLAFDLKFMAKHGIDLSKCTFEDTMINASLLNEHRSSYSLEACCHDAKVQAKKSGELYRYMQDLLGGPDGKKQMGQFYTLAGDDPMAIEYATGDGTSTWQLWESQQKSLDIESLRTVWKLECQCLRVLHRMMIRGIKVDEERLTQVTGYIKNRLKEATDALPEGLNLRSGKQIKELFDKAGITNYPSTEKGNPSFTEDWLRTTKLGMKVIAARQYGNLINSFINPMEKHLFKGRIHTEFNQSKSDEYGTITGRLSSSRPNMQQVPKRNEELGRIFRSVFIPDEGMIWASADYSQCEPRLLAHYSNCRVLVKGYLSKPPIDAHSAVAIAAGIDRTSGKRLNQGLITGMGKSTLIKELGVDEETGEKMYADYFENMPEIKPFQKSAARRMKSNGYVYSLLGRRARLDPHATHDMSYKAINRLLQCGNADIIKKAMVDIDNYLESEGDKVHMLLSIHDAIDFQFKEEDRNIYNNALEIMQDFGPGKTIDLKVPLTVDTNEGADWAIATYGE
jgi:DNA polymerase-1